MGHLVEQILVHFFNYAEGYTFLFSWIAIPLGFFTVFLFLKRNSEKIVAASVSTATSNPDEKKEVEIAPPKKEAQVNKNLVNA